MDKTLLVSAAIVNFLEAQAASNQELNEAQKEGLKVAISCIKHSYGLTAKDFPRQKVPNLYHLVDGQPPASGPNTTPQVTAVQRQQAEQFKNEGNAFLAAKKAAEAARAYTQAIDLDPENAVYYCNRAAAFTMMEEFESAIQDCLAAISIKSDYAKAHSRLGTAYLGLKNSAKAIEAFERALKYEPENQAYKASLEQARGLAKPGSPTASTASAGSAGSNCTNPPNPMANLGNLAGLFNNPQVMESVGNLMRDPGAMQRLMRDPNITAMMQNFMGTQGGASPRDAAKEDDA